LEKEYKERLKIGAFLRVIALFKDEGNIVTFLTLDNVEYRDLWLEIEINSRLK
jgi:mRNA-degrading endonuclease RelE of RelBE toxin-antitoxin system